MNCMVSCVSAGWHVHVVLLLNGTVKEPINPRQQRIFTERTSLHFFQKPSACKFSQGVEEFFFLLSVSSYMDFSWLSRAVNHVRGSVWGTRRQGGDSAAGFPKTALIIGGTSDFVPRWQMVGWGGIQGGRFTSIVRAHKLHTETIASVRGQGTRAGEKKKKRTFLFNARRTGAEINF